MGTRKNAAHLTVTERDDFLERLLRLKNTPSPEDAAINIYDQYVALHRYVRNMNPPGGANNIDMAHAGPAFLSWHRYYLLRFESALQAMIPADPFALPYWDWTEHTLTGTVLFQPNFMGPNGGLDGAGGTIAAGYFRFTVPAAEQPGWWPAGLPGWRVRTALDGGPALGTTLRRNLGNFTSLATPSDINGLLELATFSEFRSRLEGGARLHNSTHIWFGHGSSHMRDSNISPNDPMFWLHHCNVDRLWAMWQIDGHQGAAFYPGPGAGDDAGHDEDDPMWPWVGALAGYSSNNALAGITLPNFTGDPVTTPGDVLNHRALGYSYDSEVVFGVALDQTGSMTGLTPDPMTGTGSVSKWEAAKAGVSAFLQDCEAAYAARRAYVTAGVKTFRDLPPNTYTAIFSGTPYGLIKNGTPYSRATFDANILAQSPSGGTPIAGALTDTETNLVRPPFGNAPSADRRYLAMLTDGIETSPPLLGSLPEAPPAFPNTVVFAMGFGMGGGWNGVNYAAITDITQKGAMAPTEVDQVYHGESAGAINKFFTNTLAAALGYDPAIDPNFELFAGEHLHFPFSVTDADESFMITVQGFDFSDRNWELCLMPPAGEPCVDTRGHHGDEAHHHDNLTCCAAPFSVTLRRGNGRFTVFLDRGGAPSALWVGQWSLMVFYRAEHHDAISQMPNIADLLVPAGAPPLRGPLYARHNQPLAKRQAVRAVRGGPSHSLVAGISGLSSGHRTDPCALAVDIYARSRIKATLEVEHASHTVGDDVVLRLRLNDIGVGVFSDPLVIGRLIAPAYSTGNAFADLDTIPVAARRKYLSQVHGCVASFDHVRYLADYETKRPGVFAIRDEILSFEPEQDGSFRAVVSGNRFPGVYRIAVYITAHHTPAPHALNETCCKPRPQSFERVLNVAVALDLRIDAQASRPFLHWIAPNRVVATVTPQDKLGNVADPARGGAIHVLHKTVSLQGAAHNPYTGERHVELRLEGKDFFPAPDGQTIVGKAAHIDAANGKDVRIEPDVAIQLALNIAGVVIPVQIPSIVGDRRVHRAFAAGTLQVMMIPLEDRDVFFSEDAARAAGYTL